MHINACPCGCDRDTPVTQHASELRAAALLATLNLSTEADGGAGMRVVTGSRGGQFLIDSNGTVYQRTSDGTLFSWCLVIRDNSMPPSDMVYAKALLIQADEQLFCRTAKGGPVGWAQPQVTPPPIQEGRLPTDREAQIRIAEQQEQASLAREAAYRYAVGAFPLYSIQPQPLRQEQPQ